MPAYQDSSSKLMRPAGLEPTARYLIWKVTSIINSALCLGAFSHFPAFSWITNVYFLYTMESFFTQIIRWKFFFNFFYFIHLKVPGDIYFFLLPYGFLVSKFYRVNDETYPSLSLDMMMTIIGMHIKLEVFRVKDNFLAEEASPKCLLEVVVCQRNLL